MKIVQLILLLLLPLSLLSANVYYSKVEPYETRKIASNVVGVVLSVNEDLIGKKLSGKSYIVIDSKLDRDELKFVTEKLGYLNSTVSVNEKVLQNLGALLGKKRENYERVKELKIKSNVEKDKEFYDLVNSENTFLGTQKELNTLKTQIADLNLRKAQLKRSISDKNLNAKGMKLYEINVKVGEVVNKGTPLATLVDVNRAILTIYLNEEDVIRASKSVVYIDGEKTNYKVNRLLNIADSKNISKYKAQILIKKPKIFSKLVKIELKEQ